VAGVSTPAAIASSTFRTLTGQSRSIGTSGGAGVNAPDPLFAIIHFNLFRMDNITTIRALNADGSGGLVSVSPAIAALPREEQSEILRHLQTLAALTPEDDPKDAFSRSECRGKTILWKVANYEFLIPPASANPAEQWVTRRVLVIKLAQEQ
jgi:Protein of unknown function (DUF3768)